MLYNITILHRHLYCKIQNLKCADMHFKSPVDRWYKDNFNPNSKSIFGTPRNGFNISCRCVNFFQAIFTPTLNLNIFHDDLKLLIVL